MITAKTLTEYNSAYQRLGDKAVIGFVPTMGALHEGHLSLVKRSAEECDFTVVSVFVNPTQFNNPNDFNTYPRTLEEDCLLLERAGVDIVFAPRVVDVYPDAASGILDTRIIDLGGLDNYGEGPHRPGHFNGMAQVVTRLFDLVKPSKAYFGEKDFQQLAIVEFFTKNLLYPIEIVRCPISRSADGLALSSRNALLTPEQREAAPHIYKSISMARNLVGKGNVEEAINIITSEINKNDFLEVEYVEIINALTLQPIKEWKEADNIQLVCAVFAKPVRLIDNIKLK